MKKFIKVAFCCFLSVSLFFGATACSRQSNPSDGGSEGTLSGTLHVWGINPVCIPGYEQTLEVDPANTNGLYTKWLIDSFKEEYPDIDVRIETAGWELELNKNIMTAIAAGTQPDAMATATYTPLLARYGHLAELNLSDETETDLVTNLDDFCFHQGKRYAVPVTQQLFNLSINMGVLRKAGILNADNTVASAWESYNPLAPKTWEDLLVISQAIKSWAATQSGDDKNIGGFLMCSTAADSHIRALAVMATAGGDFADNYGNVYLNSTENVKAYTYMRNLWKSTPNGNGSATSLAALNAMFYSGLAAYGFMDAETVIPMVKNGGYPNCKLEDMIWSELPCFEGSTLKGNVSIGGILFGVLDESDNQAAAKKFIEHLLSYDAQKNVFDIIGRLPVRKSVLQAIKDENSENYQLQKSIVDPFLDDSYTINKGIPTLENNSSLCWDTWNGMWQKVLTTDEDIPTLLRNCSQKWENYLAEED